MHRVREVSAAARSAAAVFHSVLVRACVLELKVYGEVEDWRSVRPLSCSAGSVVVVAVGLK